jgi:NAD(P)-dependent dehydrogenase (short-subunit alcohol dehydrogenase family)
MELQDRLAVVTGGGSGIGEALCRRFVSGGARHVVVADRDGAGAERVAASLAPAATAVALDVADEAAINRVVARTEEAHGPIDLFVSNAGYGRRGGLELANEDFQRMWDVHVMAHVYAARAVLPSMIARGEGYLLNTASAAGLLTQMDSVVYALTKHAAVALAEWLAINHHHHGVRVSVLCPQAVDTAILRNFDGDAGDARGGGQAGGDGVLSAEVVAEACVAAMAEERFWVLPHPEVATYVQRKATDVDRWLGGMRRYANSLWGESGLPGDWFAAAAGVEPPR